MQFRIKTINKYILLSGFMYRYFQHAFGRYPLSGALQMNVPELILFPLLKNMPEVMIQGNIGVSFMKN